MIESDLTALCLEYQNLLRMRDWRIGAKFVSELPSTPGKDDEGCLGRTWFSYDIQIGIINVLSKEGYDNLDAPLEAYDPEHILVHELLHIRMNITGGDSISEFGLDSTAEALVRLRRLTHEKFDGLVRKSEGLELRGMRAANGDISRVESSAGAEDWAKTYFELAESRERLG